MVDQRKERTRWMLVGMVAAAVLLCTFWVQRLTAPADLGVVPGRADRPPERIISMAPSITEILFTLGLGDSVVGVTRYCDYPPAATERAAVGGYFDPNYEAMTALAPDLVVLLPEHEEPRQYLNERGIEVLTVNHRTLAGIIASIRQIGERCGMHSQSEALIRRIDQRLGEVAEKTAGLERCSVMLAVGRDLSADRIEKVYIAGAGTWYEELIDLAGGVNAYRGRLATPTVSAEGIVSMDPRVIVEILGNTTSPDVDPAAVLKAWRRLPSVSAVRTGRVHLFTDDFAVIPGPRFVLILEKLAAVLHPGLDLKSPPLPRGGSAAGPAASDASSPSAGSGIAEEPPS